ncbi:MAG: hypothetical protein NDI69_09900 [Bacteriovoracaceae bacterium]|nr:hypothetical protein [Bacteriovoracaceae bacterium]
MKKSQNKKLIIGLSLLSGISYFATDLSVGPRELKTTSMEHKIDATRHPSSQMTTTSNKQKLKEHFNFKKNKSSPTFEGISMGEVMPNGYKLATGVYAVKSSEFFPTLGEKIEDKNGLTFFTSEHKPSNAINVVFDENNKKLYTISSVLKIKNVDETLRSELISAGLTEHYYHEGLRVLYVKSSHDEILSLQEELKKLKFDIQLEVVKATHKPR